MRLVVSVRTLFFAAPSSTSRPDAAAQGAGAMIYDTGLTQPLWSDGSVWRDATGTAV